MYRWKWKLAILNIISYIIYVLKSYKSIMIVKNYAVVLVSSASA